MYSANREDILNMSNKEIEMSISSGEINVSAHSGMDWLWQKQAKEIFRRVDVVTNDLIEENEGR